MDRITAEILCKLTDDFYAAQARSFSASRQAPWDGWRRLLRELGLDAATAEVEDGLFHNASVPYTVLDVGAGNLRFLVFLHDALPAEMQKDFYAVDNCPALVPSEEVLANDFPYVRFEKVDVLQRLLHGASLAGAIEAPPCSLVACFGLFHHVPGMNLRADLLASLVRMAAPGGHVAVSFWRFENSPELASKAAAFHPQACAALGIDPSALDAGDYLLGWQDQPPAQGSVRYCHSFSHAEIDELAASVAPYAAPQARFDADGRGGNLNHYLVLRVSEGLQ